MKAADIEVGREYAYSRWNGRYTKNLSGQRVKVITRADVPEGATVRKQDDNASVLVATLDDDGTIANRNGWESPYQFVAARWIQRTWEEEAARQAARKAAWAAQEKAAQERKVDAAAAREEWAHESAEFIAAAEALGIPTDFRSLKVNTTYPDGSGTNTLTLSRATVAAITAALRAAVPVAA